MPLHFSWDCKRRQKFFGNSQSECSRYVGNIVNNSMHFNARLSLDDDNRKISTRYKIISYQKQHSSLKCVTQASLYLVVICFIFSAKHIFKKLLLIPGSHFTVDYKNWQINCLSTDKTGIEIQNQKFFVLHQVKGKTKQNKTKQNKTKQNKTKQNKTKTI